MANETTSGRPFRPGDAVLIECWGQPCRFRGYISPSIIVVECPNHPGGERIEAPLDRVWPDSEEGILLKATYKLSQP